jgi:hypothetical protein
VNTVGAILTCLFSVATFFLPRRLAALSMLAATLYITEGQALDLGINFLAIRFVESAAFLRVIRRGELFKITFTSLDRWLLVFFVTLVGILTLRTGIFDWYIFGQAVDGCLAYFCFRSLITNFDEFTFFLKGAAMLLVPYALLMILEAQTGRNLFALMGGVPDTPELRGGHYRCQGSFRHAITAGSLGATFLSLYVGFLFQQPCRRWAAAGIGACIVIVFASHSSGPLMAAITALVGWACWYARRDMKWVRRAIVAILVFLQLTMSSPAWFIFDRLSGIFGGDGWHRSNLIDQFIHSFSNWWLAGMPFEMTSDWASTQMSWGAVDVTNYYISIGIVSGLLPFILFLVFLTACLKSMGRALARLRTQPDSPGYAEVILWGVGCTICVHVVNLTAVSYWDQFYVIWYLHLAIATSLSAYILSNYPSAPAPGTPALSGQPETAARTVAINPS